MISIVTTFLEAASLTWLYHFDMTEVALSAVGARQISEARRHDVALQMSLAAGTPRRPGLEETEVGLLDFSAWDRHAPWPRDVPLGQPVTFGACWCPCEMLLRKGHQILQDAVKL
jgi:hypothetical protein